MTNLEGIFDTYCNNLKNCIKCPYSNNNKADLIGCALNFGYQKGREDAIDECINAIEPNMQYAEVCRALKQLKEQKNDNICER